MEEIEKKLKSYFNRYQLSVLDEDPHGKGRGFYYRVTFDYIVKYVLKNEYSEDEVAKVIAKMSAEKKLNSIYCSTPRDMVFHNGAKMNFSTENKISPHFFDDGKWLHAHYPRPMLAKAMKTIKYLKPFFEKAVTEKRENAVS